MASSKDNPTGTVYMHEEFSHVLKSFSDHSHSQWLSRQACRWLLWKERLWGKWTNLTTIELTVIYVMYRILNDLWPLQCSNKLRCYQKYSMCLYTLYAAKHILWVEIWSSFKPRHKNAQRCCLLYAQCPHMTKDSRLVWLEQRWKYCEEEDVVFFYHFIWTTFVVLLDGWYKYWAVDQSVGTVFILHHSKFKLLGISLSQKCIIWCIITFLVNKLVRFSHQHLPSTIIVCLFWVVFLFEFEFNILAQCFISIISWQKYLAFKLLMSSQWTTSC